MTNLVITLTRLELEEKDSADIHPKITRWSRVYGRINLPPTRTNIATSAINVLENHGTNGAPTENATQGRSEIEKL